MARHPAAARTSSFQRCSFTGEHEEPQDQRCPEESEKCNAEEQTRLKVPI
jgi:hypothetical protein